ncbi:MULTISPECIES: hypothetical protein [Amycolatopsis]|uniref:Uncharacterized protein n=1 Tax=Amycolatopsis dongchuanensis TaxID=1070866 RepID=A0ABP9PYT3_9PSEU
MRTRQFLTVGALALTLLTGTPAFATESTTAPSCTSTVTGTPGQQVLLAPGSVVQPVVDALSTLDPLGVLTAAFRSGWAAQAPIPVGVVPEGEAEIPGGRIADAVTDRLGDVPLLAPVLSPLVSSVRSSLAAACGILVRGPVVAPAPAPTPASPGPATAPLANPRVVSATPVPGAEWTVVDTPGAPAGGVVFGTRLPGLLPGGALFPPLSGAGAPQAGVAAGDAGPAVVAAAPQSAGSGEALPVRRDELSLPVLTAVLLLAVVSAQLVRRWVLRGSR